MKKHYSFIVLLFPVLLLSCRGDELVVPTEYETLPVNARALDDFADNEPIGMYLLNEGNMGSNKATIDYIDFANAQYIRNIYAERNPNVVMELGDVGNDIQIYGSKLYAVINCSHKVEIMDAKTCKRITQVDIPNCRYIRFADNKAYVTSYIGAVGIDPNAQLGAVFEIDTATLQITRQVTVGYQPDGLEIMGDYIYVANSGGYRAPNYDSTISVVDRKTLKQVEKIPVALNLQHIHKDNYGKLWVSSRGNYSDIPSKLCVLEHKGTSISGMTVTDTIDQVPCSDMVIIGDSLYYYSVAWNNRTESNSIEYGIINVQNKQVVSNQLITDGTDTDIKVPYGIAVNPYSHDIYITDAKNYVTSGMLHCYSHDGKKKWSIRTGDIPAHLAFIYK